MNENNGAIRDASVLGVPKMLILGLQHMFAMFGATILVPILVNSYFGEDVLHVQVTLICAGVGTLFFHLCSKFKVPAFYLALNYKYHNQQYRFEAQSYVAHELIVLSAFCDYIFSDNLL